MRTGVTEYNISPPYITASSDVRHIDLDPIRDRNPTLLLYSDGVNNIVRGKFVFRQENPYRHDPAPVMGALFGDRIDQEFMRDVFDHEVELKWLGKGGNRAVEVLGNILAGTDAHRLNQVLSPDLLSEDGKRDLYIDDTTIIICPLN